MATPVKPLGDAVGIEDWANYTYGILYAQLRDYFLTDRQERHCLVTYDA